jgi:predicted CoA-binding protein
VIHSDRLETVPPIILASDTLVTEIRDGLTTEMRYAVYALGREFGPEGADARHTADADFYRILRKPPYEALKAFDVMRNEWKLDVIPVCPDRATVLGETCYPALTGAPHLIDCVVSFLPSHLAHMLAHEMKRAGVPVLWRMFGPVINGFDTAERAIYDAAGIRTVNGCVLAHWDVAATDIPLSERLHHACYIHGLRAKKLRGPQKRT